MEFGNSSLNYLKDVRILYGPFFQIASLSIPRKNLAVAIYEDELFAIGGSTAAGASNMVECYDEHRNEWIQMEPLIQAKSNCGTAIMLEAPE